MVFGLVLEQTDWEIRLGGSVIEHNFSNLSPNHSHASS